MTEYVNDKKGFTLLEVMIVVAIIGVLAAIALSNHLEAVEYARGAKLVEELRVIDEAVMMYNADHEDAITEISGSKGSNNLAKNKLVPDYMSVWPDPPIGNLRIKCTDGKTRRFIVPEGSATTSRHYYSWNSQKEEHKKNKATFLQLTRMQYLSGNCDKYTVGLKIEVID